MASLFFVGGFPQNTSQQELEEYIQNDLDVKNLKSLWFDPRHERRAVFFCSQELDIKKIDDLLQMKPLKEKTLFGGQEKETEVLFVEVPSMKCKALIDKLPWLFHQRKNGGSKVTDIEEMKENNFKLTFLDGWDAVLRVIVSDWYIGETKVKVTPFFHSFQEGYKAQKQYYKPKELTHQAQENPMVSTKSSNYRTEQIGVQESANQIRLQDATATPATSPHKSYDHFHNPDESALPSESPCDNPPQIVKQNKSSAPSESPGENAAQNKKIQLESLSESQSENAAQNIKKIQPESPSESLGEIAAPMVKHNKPTLPSKSPKKSVTVPQKKSTKGFKTTKHFDPISNALPVLLDCLSLTKNINERYPDVEMTIDLEETKISLKGPLLLLEPVLEAIIDQDDCIQRDDFNLFLCSTNRQYLQQYFHDHSTTAVLEDKTNEGGLEILVQFGQKKKSLLDYLSSKIKLVEKWPSIENEKMKQLRDYISKFNNEHFEYKLVAQPEALKLFHFGVVVDKNEVLCEIQNALESEPNLKLNPLNASTDKSDELQEPLNQTHKVPVPSAKVKPVLAPKPKIEKVGLQLGLFDLLICLSLEGGINICCPTVKVEMDKEDEFITLKGRSDEVTKLKNTLLSMNQIYGSISKNYCDTYQQLFASIENQKLFKEHFKLLLEPVEAEFVVYIQDNSDKKRTFEDFAARTLKLVNSSHDMPSDMSTLKEFQQSFNSYHKSFQLIEIDNQWWVMKLSLSCDDEDDQVVTKYKDKFFSNCKIPSTNDSNKDATQRRQNVQRDQCRSKMPLIPKAEHFLKNASRCDAMRRKLKGTVSNVEVEGYYLYYHFCINRANAVNALNDYLSKIQEKKIYLDYPGVKEFFKTNQGQRLFSEIADKFECVVTTPCENVKAGNKSAKTERHYKVTLLGTTRKNNVYFHVTQGDGRNVKVDGYIHVQLQSTGEAFKGSNKMTISLPNWSFKDGGKKGEEELTELTRKVFEEVMGKGWQHIAVSISSDYVGRFPCQILSRIIIEEACMSFGQKAMDVFLCEAKSVPLLKAFQYTLTGSTDFTQPSETNLNRISDQVLFDKNPDHYTDKMKFSVSTSWHGEDKKHAKETLMCFPIQTPLDASRSPLKGVLGHDRKYNLVIKKVDADRPDGLLVGEVFPLSDMNLFESSVVALYGCQQWDIDVKKALQETLSNCLDAGRQYTSLHIIVPGAIQPFIYPREWLVSKWFEHLDKWMKDHAHQYSKYPKYIHFVVENHQWKELFDEHLKRREKRNWNIPGLWKAPEKQSVSPLDFLILSHESYHVNTKNVVDCLKAELKALMERNIKTKLMTFDLHRKLEKKFASDNPKIKLTTGQSDVQNKKRRKPSALWKISGLTEESVDAALSSLCCLISENDPNGSSVDHQYGKTTCIMNSQYGGSDAEENTSDFYENDLVEECHGEESEENNAESGLVLQEQNTNDSFSRQTAGIGIKSDEVPDHCLPSVEKNNAESGLVLQEQNTKDSFSRQTAGIGVKSDEVPDHCLPSVEDFEWYYHDGKNSNLFSDGEATQLERSYRKDPFCDIEAKKMKVNFSTMLATSKHTDLKSFAIIRIELIKSRSLPRPALWSSDRFKHLRVKDPESERVSVLKEICEDFEPASVIRIQSIDLYRKFYRKKTEMGNQYEEKVLWQIVNADCKNLIMEHGCQKPFLTLRCDELGDGICFGSQKQCSDMIKRDTESNTWTLVRCLVYLGAEGKGQRGLRFPPVNCSSVSNEDFSMVFSSIQAYPTHFVGVQLWSDVTP